MHKRLIDATNLCAVTLLAVGLVALPASAGDFSFKLEPGVVIPLSDPQSELYGIGGGVSLKALFAVTPYWDIGPALSMVALPAEDPGSRAGTAWAFGGGLRLKRPHDAVSLFGISPWIDTDFFISRTGSLTRPAFDAAVGFSVPIGKARHFWVGPFVRYFQVFQYDRDGAYDNRDAKLLTIGLSFELGSGIHPLVTGPTGALFSDRDGDGIADPYDHCPDRPGTPENFGCPVYKRVIVHEDRLELTEKLYFAWDKATLEDASFPVLDEVAEALADHSESLIQIQGHADSTGSDDHN